MYELKATGEELESSNEELKASNEEVMSMNEELETSKEELQSMNEELATVNSQLRDKVEELDRANDDIGNFLKSTDIATVFLDTESRIRRFTPAIGKLLNLLDSDIGRPFRDFSSRFDDESLLEEASEVLAKLAPIEKEIRSEDGRYYLRRIRPYRTQDQRIEGVVITFVDITERVRGEAESRRLATVLRDSNDAVTLQELDGRIIAWNRGAEKMYGYREAEALSMKLVDLLPEDRRDEALAMVKRLADDEDVSAFATQRLTKDGKLLDVWLAATPLKDENGVTVAVATTERDITAWKTAEASRERELDASEKRFRVLAENVPAFFAYVDADGRYAFANKRHEALFGISCEEIAGKSVVELIGEQAYAIAKPTIAAALSGTEARYEAEFPIGGETLWLRVHLRPDIEEDGKVKGYFALAIDVTGEKRNARSLQESRDRLASVLDTVAEAIVTIDRRGRIDGFNQAAERLFGYSEAESIGRNVSLLMPELYGSEHDGYIERYLRTGDARVIGIGREVTGQRKDGTSFPVELAVSEIDHQQRFTGVIRDITERKRAEEILELSREELRMLSVRLLAAEESERRRLSRELHDDFNQRLAMLAVDLENLSGAAGLDAPVASKLTELRDLVTALSDDVHAMAYRLHPSILDDLGLVAAVRAFADDFSSRQGIAVSLRERRFPRRLSKELASCLYRVVQESLTNIAKHSQSPRVQIRLAGTEQRLRLSIRDYGVGFDVQAARNHRQSLGIVSMEERVRMTGGHLSIWSSPSKGTRIRVTVSRDGDQRDLP